MTPEDILNYLNRARESGSPDLWREAGEAILDQNMFIGYPAKKDTSYKGRLDRILTHGGRCNKCGEWCPEATRAVWIKSMGVWHLWCYDE